MDLYIMENLSISPSEFPQNAKFVVYKFPLSTSTLQKTLLTENDKNWDSVKANAPEYSYGFILKDANHKELSDLFLMDVIGGKVRNVKDLTEQEIYSTFQGNEALNVTSEAGVETYVITKIGDVFAFDPNKMKIV